MLLNLDKTISASAILCLTLDSLFLRAGNLRCNVAFDPVFDSETLGRVPRVNPPAADVIYSGSRQDIQDDTASASAPLTCPIRLRTPAFSSSPFPFLYDYRMTTTSPLTIVTHVHATIDPTATIATAPRRRQSIS